MLKAWIFNGTAMFILGFICGWILLKRPQWIEAFWQWIKKKVLPNA